MICKTNIPKLAGFYFCAIWELPEGKEAPVMGERPIRQTVLHCRAEDLTDSHSGYVWILDHEAHESTCTNFYVLPNHELPSIPGENEDIAADRGFRRGWHMAEQQCRIMGKIPPAEPTHVERIEGLKVREEGLKAYRELRDKEKLGNLPQREAVKIIRGE